jgi:hypothetical protein
MRALCSRGGGEPSFFWTACDVWQANQAATPQIGTDAAGKSIF